ncbi:GSCFA domain-containing protein [Neptunicoccus sediminis]|uniref:GSCFA domain-containing protein n=1 Tax=Neptunicoccus sediminis TaxID=1892596 RepID=UPI000845ED50|nr:GSCFA domain-containing protein [Neptunicoccus sediminis]
MNLTYRLDAKSAYAAAKNNQSRKYPDALDERMMGNLIMPTVRPSFLIEPKSTVFTIGSCFARNVEEALVEKGIYVPANDYSVPEEEAPGGRSNRVLNQYNPGTMWQAVSAVRDGVSSAGFFPASDGKVVDALLSTGKFPVGMDRAIKRRQEIVDLYKNGLNKADTVIITLGLVETWFDLKNNLFLNQAPDPRQANREPDRFQFRRLNVTECAELVEKMIVEMRRERTPNILLTVSPVPLAGTFTDDDCVIANTYSKSVLRVVSDIISSKFDGVDYFPSYEIVTTAGRQALHSDNIHVKDGVVKRIVGHMLEHYS